MFENDPDQQTEWEDAAAILADWIECLAEWKKDPNDPIGRAGVDIVRSFWDNESWESIVKKFQTEGSTWVVWWYDGVNAFITWEKDQQLAEAIAARECSDD